MSPERRELLRDLLARVVMVAESDADTKDLRVAVHRDRRAARGLHPVPALRASARS